MKGDRKMLLMGGALVACKGDTEFEIAQTLQRCLGMIVVGGMESTSLDVLRLRLRIVSASRTERAHKG